MKRHVQGAYRVELLLQGLVENGQNAGVDILHVPGHVVIIVAGLRSQVALHVKGDLLNLPGDGHMELRPGAVHPEVGPGPPGLWPPVPDPVNFLGGQVYLPHRLNLPPLAQIRLARQGQQGPVAAFDLEQSNVDKIFAVGEAAAQADVADHRGGGGQAVSQFHRLSDRQGIMHFEIHLGVQVAETLGLTTRDDYPAAIRNQDVGKFHYQEMPQLLGRGRDNLDNVPFPVALLPDVQLWLLDHHLVDQDLEPEQGP